MINECGSTLYLGQIEMVRNFYYGIRQASDNTRQLAITTMNFQSMTLIYCGHINILKTFNIEVSIIWEQRLDNGR